MKKNFLQSLPFNKANFQMLEQERNMLKITLQYISAENDKLKNELEDMKITAKKNKEMLKEYVTQITNKDKVFEKMNAQIEQLTNRLKILENFKKLNSKKINMNPINTNSSNKIENKTTTYTNTNMNSLTNTNSNNNTYESKNNPTQGSISMKKTDTRNSNHTNTNKSFSYIPNKNISQKTNLGLNKGKEKNNNNKNENNNNSIINEFLLKQATLIEEMSSIKDDIQFILENKTRSKMKEKLNQSIYSSNNNLNNSFISNNSSVIHNPTNNNNNISYISGNSSLNNSIISASSSSITSSHRNSHFYNGRRKFNIKDRFSIEDNFTDFLSNYNQYKNILFLIDNNDNVWELVKRIDLNINNIINNPSNLKSVIFCEKINDKLNNIEIKEPFENKSLLESEEEITSNNHKYSEFNLSKYIKESE
jgi:hypothetical protein